MVAHLKQNPVIAIFDLILFFLFNVIQCNLFLFLSNAIIFIELNPIVFLHSMHFNYLSSQRPMFPLYAGQIN